MILNDSSEIPLSFSYQINFVIISIARERFELLLRDILEMFIFGCCSLFLKHRLCTVLVIRQKFQQKDQNTVRTLYAIIKYYWNRDKIENQIVYRKIYFVYLVQLKILFHIVVIQFEMTMDFELKRMNRVNDLNKQMYISTYMHPPHVDKYSVS